MARWAENWTEDSNCKQVGPAFHYPEKGETDLANTAIRICKGEQPGFAVCPVMDECLAQLLAHETMNSIHGIWAGMHTRQAQKAWSLARRRAS
jgi:hypothetical protein